jgi:aminoglycoside/choline kinase family phosphotransferase
VQATAILKDISYDEAELVLDAVVSWAHVNESQWLAVTTEMTENVLQPFRRKGKLVVE